QLNAALAMFERLGAGPWVDRTTAELRASGQTKPRAGENVLDRLTPQEFEIVTLAASGLTNKQIAGRLFLSHRTVGGHLHRAFPKLGVATRAALRAAPPPGPSHSCGSPPERRFATRWRPSPPSGSRASRSGQPRYSIESSDGRAP